MQYGRECWCGKSKVFEDYIRHGEGTCHMACSGDETVSCGELLFCALHLLNAQDLGVLLTQTSDP